MKRNNAGPKGTSHKVAQPRRRSTGEKQGRTLPQSPALEAGQVEPHNYLPGNPARGTIPAERFPPRHRVAAHLTRALVQAVR